MAEPIFPLEVWTSQITQASVPANENALRVEVLERAALGIESVQPGASATDDGDVYILGATPSGAQWGGFSEGDVVIYKGGTWLAFAPFEGWVKTAGGTAYLYTGGAWATMTAPATPSPVVTETASATLGLSHAGAFVQADHATVAIALTVPPQASVAWEANTELTVRRAGAAAVSFVAGSGVTIQCPASQSLNLNEQYSVASLKRVAEDVWALFGDLEAA